RLIVPWLVGAAAGILPLLFYNNAAWGSFFETGYAFKAQAQQAAIHAHGVAGVGLPTLTSVFGVLVSARRGLLFFSPALIVVGFGLRRMWHERKREAQILLAAIVAYLFFATGFYDWPGGWSAAARHVVPLLPVLVLPFIIGDNELIRRPYGALALPLLAGWS